MQYQKFLRKSTYRRYGIFIATIIFSYYSIQAYVNNKSIDVSIQNVQQDIVEIQEEIAYMNNFYKNYLETEYASYFLWHENGKIYGNERIVRLTYPHMQQPQEEELVTETEQQKAIYIASPQESRHYFFEKNLSWLRRLWILE